MGKVTIAVLLTLLFATVDGVVKPSAAHIAWHEDNLGCIIHFGMQTMVAPAERTCPSVFSADTFQPALLQTDQWLAACSSFGARYAVLVAQHFSGFALYNTSVHNYSVAHSSWRGGQGDVVAEFLVACRRYGIRPGLYFSVHENWYFQVCNFTTKVRAKQAAYEQAATTQLHELAGKYGDSLAELWFDAGVGQQDTFPKRMDAWVATLPPLATCHSCSNLPQAKAVTWMGNEEQNMGYPAWATTNDYCSGWLPGGFGNPNGTRYCPAHCDGVLREHYWFWQPGTEGSIQSTATLLQKYITSVGRGCNLIMDVAPNSSGLVPAPDMEAYASYGAGIRAMYARPLAQINISGSYPQGVVEFGTASGLPVALSSGAIELMEDLTNGQVVSQFKMEYSLDPSGDHWQLFPGIAESECQTIGHRRLIPFKTSRFSAAKFRLSVLHAYGPPVLQRLAIYDWSTDAVLLTVLQQLST